MLIIFGFRGRGKTIATGDFHCPRCGVDRCYSHRTVRRWFTLFFIPIVPAGGEVGEHVRCDTCQTCFNTSVLATPTSAQLTENIRSAMRMCIAAILIAGDPTNVPARIAAVNAARLAGWSDYDDAALDHDLVSLGGTPIAPYVDPLTTALNLQGKETFAAQIARVALADGQCTEAERSVLEQVGASLGLSVAHLNGIIGTLASETPPV